MSITRVILVLTTLGTLLWVARCIVGHDQRTLVRLTETGVLKYEQSAKLIYSSGYLRENTHVFVTSFESVNYGHFKLLDPKDSSQHVHIQFARRFVEEAARQQVDWKTATVYASEGAGILAIVYLVKMEGNRAYLVLHVF